MSRLGDFRYICLFVATKEDFILISLMPQVVNSSFSIKSNAALRNSGNKRETRGNVAVT